VSAARAQGDAGGERRGADAPRRRDAPGEGQCPRCVHVKVVESGRGSRFLLCTRSRTDAAYRRYPPQPVVACPGFEG